MIFTDIPSGAGVFVDANIFIYHFIPDPTFGPASRDLIERASRNDITALTSSDVLSDVAHRLMAYEAIDTFGWPQAGIASRLKRHPMELAALVRFRQAVDEIPVLGVQVVSVTVSHVLQAAELSQKYGLLSGDALVVAVMQAHGLTNLASHDADFDRVPWITRYAPA